jgi:hypothetical protein
MSEVDPGFTHAGILSRARLAFFGIALLLDVVHLADVRR